MTTIKTMMTPKTPTITRKTQMPTREALTTSKKHQLLIGKNTNYHHKNTDGHQKANFY